MPSNIEQTTSGGVSGQGRLDYAVTRREWIWAAGLSVLALLLSSLPVLAGRLLPAPGLVFSGVVLNRSDYEAHVTTIYAGLRGMWTYSLMHTAQTSAPVFIKTFYILLGQIGRLVPLAAAGLFQAARVVCGLWGLLAMYGFAARFLKPVAARRAALALYAFGSGLGWLMLIVGYLPIPDISPIDFWLSDLYGFFSLVQFPHVMAVSALLWTSALALLDYWKGRRWPRLAAGAAALVVAQAFQPFSPLIVDAAIGLYTLGCWFARRRIVWWQVFGLALLAASQVPLLVIVLRGMAGDPVWQEFSRQNFTPSPPLIYYLLGLGLIGVLAGWGAWRVLRRRWSEAHFLLAWAVAVAGLAYLPLQFQRRFTEAVLGPLAVMASLGLVWGAWPALHRLGAFRRLLNWMHYPARRARALVLLLVVALAALSSLYLATGSTLLVVLRAPGLFDTSDVVHAVDWLAANTDWQAPVLSAESTGSLIGARAGHRVVLGHPIETAYYDATVARAARFYGNMPAMERRAVLAEYHVSYVFFGPAERALGGFDPAAAPYLEERFRSGDVAVYEVLAQ